MALNANELALIFLDKINKAVGGNRDAEQKAYCQAIAEGIIEYFTQMAEIVVPDHDPKMTDPAGHFVSNTVVIPDHIHNVNHLTHKTGKIK